MKISDEKKELLRDQGLTLYIIGVGVLLMVTVAAVFFYNDSGDVNSEKDLSAPPAYNKPLDIGKKPTTTPSLRGLDLRAEAVYVYDPLSEKVLYSKNAHKQLPLASLTKMMTALVSSNVLRGDKKIRIDAEDIKTEGDSGLYINERWSFSELLDFTIISSSNDGASAIATAASFVLEPNEQNGEGGVDSTASSSAPSAFIKRMNYKAKQLKLDKTFFLNETGLDIDKKTSGGYGSAEDVARLMEYIIDKKPYLMDSTGHQNLRLFSDLRRHKVSNTNKAIGDIPAVIASKTGFTDLAGGNLAVAFDAGLARPIIAVVLGSTYDGRFSDMKKIVDAVLCNRE